MGFDEGLLFDAHLDSAVTRSGEGHVDGRISLASGDYDKKLESEHCEWSCIVVCKVDKSAPWNTTFCTTPFERFEFGVVEDGVLSLKWSPDPDFFQEFCNTTDIERHCAHSTDLRTERWHVAAFTRDRDGVVRLYLDGEQVATQHYYLGEPVDSVPREEYTGSYILEMSSFDDVTVGPIKNGEVGRVALYNRALSFREMKLLANDYLNPRLVELVTRHALGETDAVDFVFNNSRKVAYGWEEGSERHSHSHSSFVLDWGECIVAVFGMHDDKRQFYALEFNLVTNRKDLDTNRGRQCHVHYPSEGYQERQLASHPPDWSFERSSEAHEIVGLQVDEQRKRIVGVIERELPQGEAVECQREIEAGYLGQINAQIDAAKTMNARLSEPIHLPNDKTYDFFRHGTYSHWEFSKKEEWDRVIRSVKLAAVEEFHEKIFTMPFLDKFEIDRGPPLHVSATAAVFGATRVEATSSEDGKTKTRRVALKFMTRPQHVIAEINGRISRDPEHVSLDPEFVVAVSDVFAQKGDAADALKEEFKGWETPLKYVVPMDTPPGDQNVPVMVHPHEQLAEKMMGLVESSRKSVGTTGSKYQYCLVLDLADTTLSNALSNYNFAGSDWDTVRNIANHLVRALDHLHSWDRIHGDFKPKNIVRVGVTWKVIDLDGSCRVGGKYGDKAPSSGYCPPEMASAICSATDKTGALDTSKLNEYYDQASVAYDLWSLGCVLYTLVFDGKLLWILDKDDNIESSGLDRLAGWTTRDCNRLKRKLLMESRESKNKLLATDLITKLLEPKVEARLGHFGEGTEMFNILRHPFLTGKDENGALLEHILKNTQEIKTQLDEVLNVLEAQFRVLSYILKGVNKLAPTLVLFLPSDALKDKSKKWSFAKLRDFPKTWLNRKVRLLFVDPISLTMAPTNEGVGFELSFPREWVAKAMPYVKIGMTALKVAAIAGRLAGVPVPDFHVIAKDFFDSQLSALGEMEDDAIKELSRFTNDPKLAQKLLADVDKHCRDAVSDMAEAAMPSEGNFFDDRLREPLEKTSGELASLLDKKHPEWKENCGLEMVVSNADGCVEWVLPQYVDEFKKEGRKLLGTESHDIPPEDS